MLVQRVQNNIAHRPVFTSKQLPLRIEIANLKKTTPETVKKLYGSFGLDIFEGKEPLTILNDKELKRSQKFISKTKTFISGKSLLDYEDGDTLKNIVFKFIGNKKSGFYKDVEEMFGEKGMEELQKLGLQGYVSL